MTRSSSLLSKFKVLCSLQAKLLLGLAFLTFQPQNNLTGSLGLLVKHGLGLSTETHLFGIITSLSLCKIGGFSSLVLGDLVDGVLLALSGTVSFAFLRYVNHCKIFVLERRKQKKVRKGRLGVFGTSTTRNHAHTTKMVTATDIVHNSLFRFHKSC